MATAGGRDGAGRRSPGIPRVLHGLREQGSTLHTGGDPNRQRACWPLSGLNRPAGWQAVRRPNSLRIARRSGLPLPLLVAVTTVAQQEMAMSAGNKIRRQMLSPRSSSRLLRFIVIAPGAECAFCRRWHTFIGVAFPPSAATAKQTAINTRCCFSGFPGSCGR